MLKGTTISLRSVSSSNFRNALELLRKKFPGDLICCRRKFPASAASGLRAGGLGAEFFDIAHGSDGSGETPADHGVESAQNGYA